MTTPRQQRATKNQQGEQSKQPKQPKKSKQTLHPKNPHTGRYELPLLCKSLPELSEHICQNPSGEDTIDFSNPTAVKSLNKALLFHHYRLTYWDIPAGFLCPPIPSRADYIHHIADVLKLESGTTDSNNKQGIRALDIGTGANLIYPIIGSQSYGWRFTATDIDPVAVEFAKFISEKNPVLKNKIQVKQQQNPENIFKGIVKENDWYDVSICNPPFHASLDEAMASNQRKQKNLSINRQKRNPKFRQSKYNASTSNSPSKSLDSSLNFGGQKAELWCEGGEIAFLKRMANESLQFAGNLGWFSTLVSKSENLIPLTELLRELGVTKLKEIPMTHGQKTTRIIAWGWE